MKHTPGPWEPWQDEPKWTPIVGEGDRIVCVIPGGPRSPDARLIAAAPELARLCSDLLNPKNDVEPIRCEVKKILRRVYGEYEEE